MRKLVSVLIVITMVLSVVPAFSVSAANDISVYIDGVRIDLPAAPINVNGTTLVPMRALFEALGAEVSWINETQTATGSAPGVHVGVQIDNPTMLRNLVDVPLLEPARIINGSTFIPLRAVSECFGMQVDWDGATNSIYLTSLNIIKKTDWNDTLYYIGEVLPSDTGYGILYEKATDIPVTYGYFENGFIVNGMRFFNDMKESYHGEFKEGIPEGFGTYFYADGSYYIGEWKNGMKHGEGEMFFSDGIYHTGKFENGAPNGYGEMYWPDGSSYTGIFKNGAREGLGLYQFSSGSYYIGEFKNDKINGEGYYYNSDGTLRYSGFFENGEYIGKNVQQSTSINPNYDRRSERLEEYWEKFVELRDFYNEEYEKIQEFIADPFSSEWAQQIMESYEKMADEAGYTAELASGKGNIDSYAAAQIKKQRESFLNSGRMFIAENYLTIAEAQLKFLDQFYNQQLADLQFEYADVLGQ